MTEPLIRLHDILERIDLAHEYWRVDARIVWETAQGELPRLRKLIEAVVTAEQESGSSLD